MQRWGRYAWQAAHDLRLNNLIFSLASELIQTDLPKAGIHMTTQVKLPLLKVESRTFRNVGTSTFSKGHWNAMWCKKIQSVCPFTHCKVEKLWGLEAWTMAAWGLKQSTFWCYQDAFHSQTAETLDKRSSFITVTICHNSKRCFLIPKKFMKSIQDQWAFKNLPKVQSDKPKFSYAPILRVSKSGALRAHSAKSRQGLPRNISLLFQKSLGKETRETRTRKEMKKAFFAPAFWVWQIQELCIVQRWRHILPLQGSNKRYIRYIRYKAYYEMWKSHSKKWHCRHALACRLCGLGVVRFSCAFKARSWASLKHRDQREFQKLFHRYDILQSQRCNRFHNQKFTTQKADLAQLLLEDAKVTNQLLKDTRVHRLHMRETNNWSIKHPNEFSSKLQKAKRSLWFEKE